MAQSATIGQHEVGQGESEIAWWREPTRGQWISFGAAWVGWVLDAFDFTIFLLVMPSIAREFGVSVTATSWSITLTLLMRLVGGVAAGSIADRFGRKLPLLISMVWFAVCDGAVGLAPSFGWVLALRILFGFGMGAEWTSGTTLAMENWPTRSRAIASGVLQGSWAVGFLLAGQLSKWIVPHWGWRALFFVAAAPALLVLPLRLWVPESEAFQKGAAERARPNASAARARFDGPTIRRIAWASGVMAFGFGAYYGLTALYATMLQTELHFDMVGVGRLIVYFNVGLMLTSIACGILASRRGVGLAVALPALLVLPFLPLYVGFWPSLLGLGALLGSVGVAYTGVTPMFLTSLFPAAIRARAVGIVYHVGSLLAALTPPLVATLAQNGGLKLSTAILCVTGGCEILIVAMLFFGRRELLKHPSEG